jgi:hypothetical protein
MGTLPNADAGGGAEDVAYLAGGGPINSSNSSMVTKNERGFGFMRRRLLELTATKDSVDSLQYHQSTTHTTISVVDLECLSNK